jgi:mono/diheme cytochrome c family protein
MVRTIAALLSLIVVVALANVGEAADAGNGETLAKRWCAACHVVASDQKDGSTQAPPFSSVANKPGFDEAKLAFFLLEPHPKMPDMGLSRSEAADLAAYIGRQK